VKLNKPLQQVFLDTVVAGQVPVTVFLVNGVRLSGILVGHDSFTLWLLGAGTTQTIFKRAVSTIATLAPLNLAQETGQAEERAAAGKS
jgi:host factor-I protein